MDFVRTINDLTKYEDRIYQATVFAKLLSRQPYYSMDPARPSRAKVCSWKEFETLVLEESNQPSSSQKKDAQPTSTVVEAISGEKSSPPPADMSSAPLKIASAGTSSTNPEKHPDSSAHGPHAQPIPIRQKTLPSSPTQLSGSPPLTVNRQKTAGVFVNGSQPNGLRKKISLPQVSFLRLWKRRSDPQPPTNVKGPASKREASKREASKRETSNEASQTD